MLKLLLLSWKDTKDDFLKLIFNCFESRLLLDWLYVYIIDEYIDHELHVLLTVDAKKKDAVLS